MDWKQLRIVLLATATAVAGGFYLQSFLAHQQQNEPLDQFSKRAAETLVSGTPAALTGLMTVPEREFLKDSSSIERFIDFLKPIRKDWKLDGKAAFTGTADGVAASLVVPVKREETPPFDMVVDIYRTESGPKILVTYSLITSFAMDKYGSRYPKASENERLFRSLNDLFTENFDELIATGVPGVIVLDGKGLNQVEWDELRQLTTRRMEKFSSK